MTSMDIDSPSTPSTALTPVTPADTNEAPISEEQPNRRRRKKSIVWEHFTIETVGAGCMRACCKQCKKSFAYITGPKLAGTSHLKRHIALGICPVSRQRNEASSSPLTPGAKTDPPRKRYRSTPAYGVIPFDQDRCNQDIAKMIIQHEYPLHIVEHPAFIGFVRTLQPQYSMASFNTIQGECVGIYLREKQSLMNLISGIPGRVNLTLDLGTSNFDIGYAFLCGHFIDEDWNLQRRILSVVMLPFPDSDYAFNQAVVSCLSDWHLESRLFSLTLDQSFSNESVMGNLRSLLPVKSQHLFNCQLLKGSCYARVLSRLAQDALRYMAEVVGRIRESVKYVKTSETHDEKFAELRQQLQVPSTKELVIDDPTKWNTTYQMLVAACELKEVFDLLDESDPVYKIKPSMNDWRQAEILCTHLKLLYDAASILTSPTYPPAHAFYHEVSKLQLELTRLAMSQDPFVSNLIRPLKEKFDQYWKDSFLILVIAVVMDPRFKMKFVEFSFQKNFGEDAGMWIKIVDDGIHELFLEYLAPNLSVTTFMGAEDMVIPQSEMLQDVVPHHQEADFHHHQLVQSVNEPTPEVHTQGATIQDVKPEKVSPDEPSQVLHHQVAQQEIHSEHFPMQGTSQQEMHIDYQLPLQDTDAQEVSPRETNTQDMPAPEAHVQGLGQETHVQEIPAQDVHSQAVPGDGIHAQELTAQDMHTEVGVQEMHHSEVVAQDMHSSEAHGHEMHSSGAQSQEMHNSGAHGHEMHSSGAHSEEMHTSEAQIQEIKTSDLETPNVQPSEAQTEEMQTCERQSAEPQTQEMNPPETIAQEMHTQEAKTQELHHQEAESMQFDEVKTRETHPLEEQSQEMHLHEVQNQEMHTQELETQEMHPQEQEVDTQEMHSQEVHDHEMQPQEVQTQEMQPQEVQTQEMQSQEVHNQEMQHQEVHDQEMQHQEVHDQEMQHQEVHDQEVQHEEVHDQEMQHQEVHDQEMQHQEVHNQEIQQEEVQSQEIQQGEVQTEEMKQELEIQEFQQEDIQTQEMQPQELQTQEMQPQEVQTQEMQPQEAQTQEMQPQEAQTQEMQPQEAQTQEMQPEVQTQEMQPQEVQTQEMEHQEVHNQEMQPQVQTQEMYHHDVQTSEIQQEEIQSEDMQQGEVQTEEMQQEVQTQEFQQEEVQTEELHLHHQEIQAQEMHHQEVQTQQMHHQGFSQEMQPYEVNHQDLHLLSNIGDGYSDFEVYISATSNQHLKSELDQYLEESLLPRVHDFDVLGWWKLNKLKYPTLSKMAADILSIPISTVPPESVFDTGSKKIDNYRSSLQSVTLEALVCAKDWLQYGSSESSLQISSAPLKIEY